MQALEGQDRVLSVSLCHGFPWADVADLGVKVVVVSDGDAAGAQALAAQLGAEVRAMRGTTAAPMLGHEEGLARALALAGRPIVLADTSDNAGGGAPSDATFLLRRLLEQGVGEVALGPFWDPVAVGFCHLAGVGAQLRLRLGGKVGPISGDPLDVEAEVLHLADGARQRFSGGWTQLGDVAAIRIPGRIGGVEVLLNATRTQAFDPALFTDHGIALADKKLVVVKSAQHFHAGFAEGRQGGAVARRARGADPGLRAPALHQAAPPDLAARPAPVSARRASGCNGMFRPLGHLGGHARGVGPKRA